MLLVSGLSYAATTILACLPRRVLHQSKTLQGLILGGLTAFLVSGACWLLS